MKSAAIRVRTEEPDYSDLPYRVQYARSAYGVSVIVEAPEETRTMRKRISTGLNNVVLTSRLCNVQL